jgi:hypothetical protein
MKLGSLAWNLSEEEALPPPALPPNEGFGISNDKYENNKTVSPLFVGVGILSIFQTECCETLGPKIAVDNNLQVMPFTRIIWQVEKKSFIA